MEKVVVGLSGGVDSFVTALLLQQQGFEVIGVHLQLWESRAGSSQEPEVEELCKQTGIKLYRLNGRQLFQEQVVQPFIQGYLSGMVCVVNGRLSDSELFDNVFAPYLK